MKNSIKAYKLLRLRKDGTLGPLFINRKQVITLKKNPVWLKSENHPTRGFSYRPGWHCSHEPSAPHLKTFLKSGEKRVWCEVEIKDYEVLKRPEFQGGIWYLAKKIRFLKILSKPH